MTGRTDVGAVHETTFEETLARKGYLLYTCEGRSMLPLLRPRRDVIEIRPKGPERLKKNDVALYRRGDLWVLHRVLRVLPEGYLIAGDHNFFVERDITDEKIIGVMTRVIRDGTSVSVNDARYRLYVHLWCDCYPLRMALLRAKAGVRRIAKRILDSFRAHKNG